MLPRHLMATLVFALSLASLCGAWPLRPNELTLCGAFSESDGLGISSMSLWLRRGEPGVAFGTSKGPGTSREYGYILLIKGDPSRERLAGHNLTCTSDGRTATGGGHVEINGLRADVAYRVSLDPKGNQNLVEGMTVNGEEFDLRLGRVFLVDLSGKAAGVRQVIVDLPQGPAVPKSTDDVDRLAKGHLKRLRQQSAVVREFLK